MRGLHDPAHYDRTRSVHVLSHFRNNGLTKPRLNPLTPLALSW